VGNVEGQLFHTYNLPEKHHHPRGEAGMTLEDVFIIWGIYIAIIFVFYLILRSKGVDFTI